jgi:hypothetical protein
MPQHRLVGVDVIERDGYMLRAHVSTTVGSWKRNVTEKSIYQQRLWCVVCDAPVSTNQGVSPSLQA